MRCGPVTGHGSRVTGHGSRVTGHGSRVTGHASRVTHHASRITPHGSRLTGHGSRVTPHGSRITHHASRITSWMIKKPTFLTEIQPESQRCRRVTVGMLRCAQHDKTPHSVPSQQDKVPCYFTVLAGARFPDALDLKPETRHLQPCLMPTSLQKFSPNHSAVEGRNAAIRRKDQISPFAGRAGTTRRRVQREEFIQVRLHQGRHRLAHQQHALLIALNVVGPSRVAPQRQICPDYLVRGNIEDHRQADLRVSRHIKLLLHHARLKNFTRTWVLAQHPPSVALWQGNKGLLRKRVDHHHNVAPAILAHRGKLKVNKLAGTFGRGHDVAPPARPSLSARRKWRSCGDATGRPTPVAPLGQ